MSERTWFPPGVSDAYLETEVDKSAIYVGVCLPSSSLPRASQAENAAPAPTLYDSVFAGNTAVATPGFAYFIGSRMERSVGRVAAAAMIGISEPRAHYHCAPSEVRHDSRNDWFLHVLTHFAAVQPYVPTFPVRTRDRERLLAPPWESEAIDGRQLGFLLGDQG